MINVLKRLLLITGCALVVFSVIASPPVKAAAFDPNNVIDDPVYENISTMDIGAIDSFLNSQPQSCLSQKNGFSTPDPLGWSSTESANHGYKFGGNVSAGTAIYHTAQIYHINPQVILATLQYEQGIVTGGSFGCHPNTPDASQTYTCDLWRNGGSHICTTACPYSGGCVPIGMSNQCDAGNCDATFEGFSLQLMSGTWLERFGQERSLGILSGYPGYDPGDDNIYYGGPMTQGNRQRVAGGSSVYYDGTYTVNGSSLTMTNGATAARYYYIPSIGGNQSFFNTFTGWFGSTLSDRCLAGGPSQIITDVGFRKFQPHLASGDFIIYSGTSTNCIESHAWNVGFGSWQNHTASNAKTIDPSSSTLQFADLTGTGLDNPVLIGFANTTSGKVEFHVWDYSMKNWIVHAISNLSTTDAQDTAITFANLDGSNVKTPVAIKYKNLSNICPDGVTHNCVEFHIWNPGLQTWKNHIITNLAGPLDPSKMQIAFADLNKDGRDEAIAMGVGNTATGNVEFHVWAPGQWSWQNHIVSNLPTAGLAGCSIRFADLDTDRIDNGVVTCTQGTSTGKIEFHVWNPGLSSWQGHYVSNQQIL